MKKVLIILLLFVLTVPVMGADAESAYNTRLSLKSAVKYKTYGVNRMIAVGAELSSAATVIRLFSQDLAKAGILPVKVSITSASDFKVLAHGLDTQLLVDGVSVTPLPINKVIDQLKKNSDSDLIRNNVLSKILRHAYMLPGQTVTGYLFFDKQQVRSKNLQLKMYIQQLNRVGYFNAYAAVK